MDRPSTEMVLSICRWNKRRQAADDFPVNIHTHREVYKIFYLFSKVWELLYVKHCNKYTDAKYPKTYSWITAWRPIDMDQNVKIPWNITSAELSHLLLWLALADNCQEFHFCLRNEITIHHAFHTNDRVCAVTSQYWKLLVPPPRVP